MGNILFIVDIFVDENVCFGIKILQWIVSGGATYIKLPLLQVVAWHRPGARPFQFTDLYVCRRLKYIIVYTALFYAMYCISKHA